MQGPYPYCAGLGEDPSRVAQRRGFRSSAWLPPDDV